MKAGLNRRRRPPATWYLDRMAGPDDTTPKTTETKTTAKGLLQWAKDHETELVIAAVVWAVFFHDDTESR